MSDEYKQSFEDRRSQTGVWERDLRLARNGMNSVLLKGV
jgi:hypothetical protein